MESLLTDFESMFNIKLVFINIMIVYLAIKAIVFNVKTDDIKRGTKQVVTGAVSLILGVIYYFGMNESLECITCSTLLAIVGYDYLIKFILQKLKL